MGLIDLKCDSFIWHLDSRKHVMRMCRGPFLVHSHMLAERVTLVDPSLYGELHPKLDVGLHSQMASSVFLSLQNE